MDVVIKSINNGQGSDIRLEDLELQLRIMQTKYNELIGLKSPQTIKEEIKQEIEAFNFFLQ